MPTKLYIPKDFKLPPPVAEDPFKPPIEEEEEETDYDKVPEPSTGVLGRVLDFVGRPGHAVAGATLAMQRGDESPLTPAAAALANLFGDRRDTFVDVADKAGLEGKTKVVAGLAGDLVLDPLNLVGGGLVKGGLKAVGMGKALAKGADAVQAAKTGFKAKLAKEGTLRRDLVEKFSPQGFLPDDYWRQRRLVHNRTKFAEEDAKVGIAKLFADEAKTAGKELTEQEARIISMSLDDPAKFHISPHNPRLYKLRNEAEQLFAKQAGAEQTAGILEKPLGNYVTYLLKHQPGGGKSRALSGKNRFNITRDIKSLEDAEKLGATTDIRQILAERLGAGSRSLEVNKFFHEVAANPAWASKKAVPGFVKVNLATEAPVKANLKDLYYHPEIAKDLEKLVDPAQFADATTGVLKATNAIWRSYALSTPGYFVRNLLGNNFNMWLGGVAAPMLPVRHAQAIKFLKDKPFDLGQGVFKADEAALVGKKYGIFGHGANQSMMDMVKMPNETVPKAFRGKFNPLSTENPFVKGAQGVGNQIEDASRAALYIDQLEKLGPLVQKGLLTKEDAYINAANHVKKYLFDYGELTSFEQKLRNHAIPFYTWTRKNLPLQVEKLLTNPKGAALLGKTRDAFNDAAEQDGSLVPPEKRPDYMDSGEFFQLPGKTTENHAVFSNAALPVQDISFFDKPGFASRFSPTIRVPLELAMNQEGFTGAPVWDERIGMLSQRKAHPAAGLLYNLAPGFAEQLGIGMKDGKMVQPAIQRYAMQQMPALSPFARVWEAATMPEERDGQRQGTIGGLHPALLSLLGLSSTSVSPEQQQQAARFKRGKERAKRSQTLD